MLCFRYQEFDSDAFQRPFYRVVRVEPDRFEGEFRELATTARLIADAKLRSDKIDGGAMLMRCGFRKICTQIELACDLNGPIDAPANADVRDRLELDDEVIAAHATHFEYDRFALDVLLPKDGHDRLYRNWIRNSLENGKHRIAVRDNNFITFRSQEADVKIDLVSVLDKGLGIGTDLIRALLQDAQAHGLRRVKVVTECENAPAVGLYMKMGFTPVAFDSVFHFVANN